VLIHINTCVNLNKNTLYFIHLHELYLELNMDINLSYLVILIDYCLNSISFCIEVKQNTESL
jgi:hypothetical protein